MNCPGPLAPSLLLLAAACSSVEASRESGESTSTASETSALQESSSPEAPMDADPWSADFDPPLELVTERVRLEPLAPRHVELDFEALMGSREHLRRTLRWGDWPREDFTLEENRVDLQRHWDEFERREAYAYTVLDADGERCVGCIYLNPFPPDAGLPEGTRAGRLAYWVIEEELETDLDRDLVTALLEWFADTWPLDVVALFPLEDDVRGLEQLRAAGLTDLDSPRAGTRMLVWEAD